MRERVSGSAAGGAVGDYHAALNSAFSLENFQNIVLSMLQDGRFAIAHPDNPKVITFGRASYRDGMNNCIFLNDGNGQNRWMIVQRMDFIDVAMTEKRSFLVSDDAKNIIEYWDAQFSGDALLPYWKENKDFGGFILDSNRPFHFFYDQLLHAVRCSGIGAADDLNFSVTNESFFVPDEILPTTPALHDKFYALPNAPGGFSWRNRDQSGFYAEAARMENALNSISVSRSRPEDADFILWIGISSEKRSWVEQIPGYAFMIAQLNKKYPCLTIYVDGMTSVEGSSQTFPEEQAVFNSIVSRTAPTVKFVSLIGMNYKEKIAYGRHIDAYITSAGSGCLVPHRFCRKRGILHDVNGMYPFAGDTGNPVHIIPEQYVTVIPHPTNKASDFASYSIDQAVMLEQLERVLHVRAA